MKLSDSLACALTKDDDTVTQEFLSHGTGDLAYIALRIALAEEVFKEEMPPVIFDESFAHIDGSRIKNVMRMLSAGDTGLQYLILTCRTDETAAADTLGCNIIRLG